MAQQNPFGKNTAGDNAFRAAYERLKAESEARKQGIASDYASAYQNLRGQSYAQGLGGAAKTGLGGGQSAMTGQRVSATQMGALGNLMQGQEKALREEKLGESSIYSNALLEGQQAQQYQEQQEQSAYNRQQQAIAITNDENYSEQEKIDLLKTLGYKENQINELLGINARNQAKRDSYNRLAPSLQIYQQNPDNPVFYEKDANGDIRGYQVINGVKTYVSYTEGTSRTGGRG